MVARYSGGHSICGAGIGGFTVCTTYFIVIPLHIVTIFHE